MGDVHTLKEEAGSADPLLGAPVDSDAVLQGILAIATEAIVTVGPELRIGAFSAGAETMFGYAAHEVLGQSLDLLLPERYRAGHRQHISIFAGEAQPSKFMRERTAIYGVRKTGEEFPIEASISKVVTKDGLVFTSIIRDMTERRRYEAQIAAALQAAEAATEAKSRFLAFMSHEIRTPLNGVLGMAQAIAQDKLPARQRERLTVLRAAGDALLVILNDILDLSKIEAGRLELEAVEFDLEPLLSSSRAAFGPMAEQKGLQLLLETEPAAGRYRGDPGRVRQIVFNLISNAVKFTADGEVRVSAMYADGALRVVVCDTGVGMAADVLEGLFQPFTQAEASTSRQYGGTGLGLAICRELAGLMGGALTVASTPAQGSIFTLAIPVERLGETIPADPAVEEAPPALPAGRLRILAAEDNPTNQMVLHALLSEASPNLTIVADGEAAVQAWETATFDVILMDVEMPKMNGLDATRAIRRVEAAQGLPPVAIIALTANAMPQQIAEYLAAGMNAAVTKPLNVGELFETLGRVLSEAVDQS